MPRKKLLLSMSVLATLVVFLVACQPSIGANIPGIGSPVEWQGGSIRVTNVERVDCLEAPDTIVYARPGHKILFISIKTKNVEMQDGEWGLEATSGKSYRGGRVAQAKFLFEVEEPTEGLVLWLDNGVRIPLDVFFENASAPPTCPPPGIDGPTYLLAYPPDATASSTGVPSASPTEVPPASPTPDAPLAALVNGQPIYLADYERQLSQYEASLLTQGIDPSSPEGQENLTQARAWILDVMIEQALTEQAAAAAGIVISDAEVDAYMQEMIAESGGEEAFQAKLEEWGETYEDAWREVRTQLIGMAMTQRIIEGVPTVAEHVHARHILVDTSQEAERILAQIEAGADFAALAEAYSQDPNTSKSGGDLGFFPRGILTAPEVEEAAFALQPGQVSGVVASMLGYHIVQVVERDPARPVSPENLHFLQDRALQEWVEGLWAQAVVQRFVETTP